MFEDIYTYVRNEEKRGERREEEGKGEGKRRENQTGSGLFCCHFKSLLEVDVK